VPSFAPDVFCNTDITKINTGINKGDITNRNTATTKLWEHAVTCCNMIVKSVKCQDCNLLKMSVTVNIRFQQLKMSSASTDAWWYCHSQQLTHRSRARILCSVHTMVAYRLADCLTYCVRRTYPGHIVGHRTQPRTVRIERRYWMPYTRLTKFNSSFYFRYG